MMKIIKLPWLKFKKIYPIVSFFKHCSMKITPSSPQIKKKTLIEFEYDISIEF